VLGLRFAPGVKRQERVNWRVRYIEGDLTRYEEDALREALGGSFEPLGADEKREWVAALTGDADVEAACREYDITLVHTKLRLFHH
jgi:phosphoribosylaminoimidazolecarboxamide formyltransferase/IMP cyclohydrolase